MSKETQTENPPIEYQRQLTEKIIAETVPIREVINHPPKVVQLHVYGAEKKGEEWTPNIEGHYAIRALVDFLVAIKRSLQVKAKERQNLRTANPNPIDLATEGLMPTILVAGGHPDDFAGYNICQIYKTAIETEMEKRRELSLIKIPVLDEETFNAEQTTGHLAADTRGEITFLGSYRKRFGYKIGEAISIGRIEHLSRIQKLAEANSIPTQTLSIEGILNYFHPDRLPRFMKMFPEVVVNEKSFSDAEFKKLFIQSTIDPKGFLIELIARLSGPLKKVLLRRIGQQTL